MTPEETLRQALLEDKFPESDEKPIVPIADPLKYNRMTAVSAWMGNLTGQDISPEDIGWQAEKDALAQEFFKMPDAKDVTDETVHDLIRSHIQTSDNAKRIALDSALSGRSFSQTLNEVQAFTGVSKTRGIRDRYVNEASNLYGNVAARVAPYRAMINNVAGTLSKEMESALPTTDAFQKAADALLLVPVEDRALVINAIGKTGGATAEERASYLSKLSGAMGRMSEQMGSSVESAMSEAALTETVAQLQEAGQMGFAKKMEAETDRQDEFRLLTQMVRDVADSEISPIKGSGMFSQLGIDLARMIPQSAVSVASPAMGFAANVAYFDATQTAQAMMEDPRLSLKQARASVALSAPISAAAETITALIPFGKVKLPFFSKWIQATTTSTGAALRNLGVRAATGTAGEIAEEYVQSAAPLISQELLGVLSADMPDVDWENRMPDFSKVAAETWAPALVFSFIGAGATSISDIKSGRKLASDLDLMVASGVNVELAGKIKTESDAGNWSQVDGLFREEFVSKSKASAPDIQAATERLKARFKAQENVESLTKLTSPEYTASVTRTATGWQVTTGEGTVIPVESAEAARRIAVDLRQVGSQEEADTLVGVIDSYYEQGKQAETVFTGEDVQASKELGVVGIRRDAGNAVISQRQFGPKALETVREEAEVAGIKSNTRGVFAHINGSNEVFPMRVADGAKEIVRRMNLYKSQAEGQPQVITFLHENFESTWQLGMANGTFSEQETRTAMRALLPAFEGVTALNTEEAQFIDNLRTLASGRGNETMLRETVSEMVIRDVLGRDRQGRATGMKPGSISRAIEASVMGANTQEEASALKSILAAIKAFTAYLKGVFGTVDAMIKANEEGKIGAEYDTFINKVLGIDEVKQMESQAIDEGMAMLGIDEEVQAVIDAGNMAFSISPALLSVQPPEGITVNTTDALPSWTIPKAKGDSPKVLNSAKARSEFYGKLDKAIAWLKADPTKIVSSEGWVTFMKMAGISGEIPLPPSGLTDIINNPAEYVKKLNGGYHAAASLTDTQTSAKQGMDGTVETRNLIGEGKAPAPFVVALHNMWGILSRMLSPIDQEGMWLRLISHRPVLDAIQSSIDGNFALTVKQWKQVVQDARAATAIESGKVGNAATSNANAFYLMLSRLNGKWSKMADVYSAPNSREMGRRFWDVGAGKLGIKNKVQRFIGLTFGIPGVIMDRWKFVEFWLPDAMEGMGAKQPSDYFKYSQNTPSDPVGIYGVYGGIDSGNETLSLAMYEAFETVLEESIRKSPELQKHLGVHSNAGGMHWFGWNAIKNEAVGHSSLDLTKDLIKAFGDKVNADQVYETITNGTYYTEGSPAAGVNVKFILKQGGVRVERTGVAGGSKPRQSRGKPRGGRGGAAEGGTGIAGVSPTFSISPAQDARQKAFDAFREARRDAENILDEDRAKIREGVQIFQENGDTFWNAFYRGRYNGMDYDPDGSFTIWFDETKGKWMSQGDNGFDSMPTEDNSFAAASDWVKQQFVEDWENQQVDRSFGQFERGKDEAFNILDSFVPPPGIESHQRKPWEGSGGIGPSGSIYGEFAPTGSDDVVWKLRIADHENTSRQHRQPDEQFIVSKSWTPESVEGAMQRAYNWLAKQKTTVSGPTFSISPAQDAEYLDLAKNPEKNRTLLQKMVDEKARMAGYDSPKVYHGTQAKFNVFDESKIGSANGRSEGSGFYFTTDKTIAEGYQRNGGNVISAYLKIEKALDYNQKPFTALQIRKLLKAVALTEAKDSFDENWKDGFLANYGDTYSKSIDSIVSEAAGYFTNEESALDQIGGIVGSGVDPATVNEALSSSLGYDAFYSKGFSGEGKKGGDIYVATRSNQVKSADPVTYDEDGNIIPLSQRFNEATPDIRFSISPVRNLNELSDQVERQFAENPVGALEVKSRVIRQFAKLADKWSNERWTPQGNKIRPISEKRTVKSLDKEQAMRQARALDEILANQGFTSADAMKSKDAKDYEAWQRFQESKDLLLSGGMTDEEAQKLAGASASTWRKNFVNAIREATKKAKAEAQAWRDETDAMQKEDWSPRESLVRDLITLEAIIAMFPQEIRGKIGGFVALARKASESARLKVLQKQLERGQVLLEKHLKEQYGTATEELLKRFKSQKDASGRITGKIISTATEQVDYAAEFIKLGIEEQADRQAALEKKVEESEDANEVQDALTKLGIARLFDMYSDKDSASRESAFNWLNDTIEAGKLGKSIVDEARKEMLTEMRQSAQSSILQGDELNPDIADNITNLNKGVFKRALLNLRGMLSEALWTTIQRLELIFGEDSKIVNHFAEKIINAANLSTDIKRLVEAQKKDALSIIFNSDSKFAHARGIAELQKVKQSGIFTRRVKKEEVKLDIETLTKLNDGTMSAETAGLRQDEVDAALEEFAANARKSTVTIERVVNAGTPVERMMSETQGIQWWLWSMQDASRKQMERDGWDADSFKQLEEFLSPEAKALGRWISGSYQDAAGMIDPIYRKLFNAPLPRTKNYSPIHRRNMNTGGDIMDIDGSDMNSGLAAGFTKARVNTTASLVEIDALAVFLAHWENVSHWVSHAELMRDMKAILLDKDTAVAIRQKKSEGYLQRLKEDVKTIEKNGTNSASELVNISRVWRWFMQYRSYKGLAFRLSPIIKQTPALLNPLIADVPAHNYMMGMARAFIEPQSFAKEVSAMWSSDIIRRRIEAGFSAESRVAMQGAGMTGSQAIVAMQAGMMPMSMVDGGWTSLGAAISFDYYRRGYMRDNPQMTPEIADSKAIARVERMIATSAQPSDVYARSLSERSGNPCMKSMSMFVSDQRKALAIELMAIRRLATGRSKNKTLDIQRAFVAHFVQAGVSQVMAVVIASLLGDDEDRDRELSREQWTLALALGPINGLFVFGRLADKIGRGLLGLRVFPADDLASKVANDLLKGGKNMDELFNPDDADDFMDALDSSSTALGAGMSAAIGPAGGAVDVGANLLREARKIQKRLSE